MTKLAQLWANIHQSPVTTILGLVAGVAAWLAARPELQAGHITAASIGAIVTGAAVALLGAFTSEQPASATTVTTTTVPK